MSSRDDVLAEIRATEHFLLVTHEHPDGDALGSLVGMHEVLRALGKQSVMFMPQEEFPLPYEYRFFKLDGIVSREPEDLERCTVIFLDCGNIDRTPLACVKREGTRILNLDHHHDNTLFGTVNHVDPEASCTAEIVWDLMGALGVQPTLPMAEALYVGLITDTGRFMYENTGPRAHLMAADMIAAGVDVHAIYRRIYEGVPAAKLSLLSRGLAGVERYDDGLLTITHLTRGDYEQTGAEDSFSEGVIDHLRALEGTAVAALVRELPNNGGGRKVSLRASDDRIDVSAIAREQGGGGHRQAAGFTTALDDDELVGFLRAQLAAQLSASVA